jgi:hypothetical protein
LTIGTDGLRRQPTGPFTSVRVLRLSARSPLPLAHPS